MRFFTKKHDFDYEEYKRIQTETNKKKLDRVFETEENIRMLSDYLKTNLDEIKFGLCHGTRRGKEQEWFMKYLGNDVKVIGTEISDTATQFPNTIQWDFHEIKPEWVNSVDFIYSNSLDHSYDMKYCLKQWCKCLRKNGICIINGSTGHKKIFSSKSDPAGYSKKSLIQLINNIAEEVKDIEVFGELDGKVSPVKKLLYRSWYYVVVRKN